MANDCLYELRVKGSKRAVDRVIACLKADYDYGKGKPKHKHFFRVFDCYDEDGYEKCEDNMVAKQVWGYCAWSVFSTMVSTDGISYYRGCLESYPKIFMGTTLQEQSRDCEIEIFSEEPGMGFAEHYHYLKGECLADECKDIITKETEDGEYQEFNPFRRDLTEEFEFDMA
jgi:hypothetical protein